jgi:chloramphenicol-sensitive protein RarD
LFSVSLTGLIVVLHERLRSRQWAAIGLALLGVVQEGWHLGGLPWVSLALAGSFGLYGLLRKQLPLDATKGLMLETACAAPLCACYLAFFGSGHFSASLGLAALLAAAGPVTAVPLLLFAVGACRLPLATLGFLQYLAPSLSFLVALFYYGEPMDHGRFLAFLAIWAGLALYTADLVLHNRCTVRKENP